MRRTWTTAAAAALAATLSAGAATAQDVTLRCEHFLAPEAPIPKYFIADWAERVERQSDGRIAVEVYPAMQLGGSPSALYDQIRDGVVDCGWVLPSYSPGRFPEVEAFELPFMTSKTAENSSKAAWDFAQTYLTERFADVHLMAMHVHGPGVLHKTGAPLADASGFEGLTLRGPTRQANKLMERLGAEPVGMPVPAFPEALARGVVDGGIVPYEVVPSIKLQELADSHTEFAGERSFYNTVFIWAINLDTYRSLPDELQAVIDDNSGRATSARAGAAMDRGDEDAIELIRATDNTIATMDAESVAEIRDVGAEITREWIDEMEAAGLPGQAMVDDARALVEKYDTSD